MISATERHKAGKWGERNRWGQVAVFERVVREVRTARGLSHAAIWGKVLLAGGKASAKAPR